MKLFKSKKPSTGITTSCISSKVGGQSNNNSPNYQDDKSETTSAATTNGGLSQGNKRLNDLFSTHYCQSFHNVIILLCHKVLEHFSSEYLLQKYNKNIGKNNYSGVSIVEVLKNIQEHFCVFNLYINSVWINNIINCFSSF